MFQKVSILYNLTRIYHYYGKIIFVTVLGTTFVANLSHINFLIIFLANILMTVFFFSYNNVQDYKDDARDKSKTKHNPISQKKISLFWAKVISFSSLVISLFLFYLLGLNTFLIGLVIGAICFLYSWKRVRLKSKPVVDLVSHGMFHALIFINTCQ